ncbi:hypothetical protein [Jiangella rhizosphaerae]|uniref:hypothetical protein n=1 Tax=Jiangella rhizosphaerae TaxID=2293569 RepID=UPI0018F636F8|nr:hypothetical protein [Jiangella rhizosphaerae]
MVDDGFADAVEHVRSRARGDGLLAADLRVTMHFRRILDHLARFGRQETVR